MDFPEGLSTGGVRRGGGGGRWERMEWEWREKEKKKSTDLPKQTKTQLPGSADFLPPS